MLITFDAAKQTTNKAKHNGLDFADLDMAFFDRAVISEAKLGRLRAVGRYGDTIISVIFTLLGTEAISVISMRSASKKERKMIE